MKANSDAIIQREQAAYLERLLRPRDPVLSRMEARAEERGYPISDPEVAEFLFITARARAPRLIVELGANIGYGAIVLARGAGEGARVTTIEYNESLCEEARGFIESAGLAKQVGVVHGRAIEELEKIKGPIDFVYIDCVKEEYPRYLELAIPRLAPRGVIIADNVLWRGLVAKEEVPESERARVNALRDFNTRLMSHPDLTSNILPFGDGVAYAIKKG